MTIDTARVNPAEVLASVSPHLHADVGYLLFPHNWEAGFDETWTWNTEILASRDRTEQRIQLRLLPRRSWALQLLVSGRGRRKLETWMRMRATRWLLVPLWRDAAAIKQPISAGEITIPLDTQYLEYSAGDAAYTVGGQVPHLVVVWDAWDHFEVRTITEVAAGSVTVDLPFAQDWPAGTLVAPCSYGIAAGEQRTVKRFTEDVGEYQLAVQALYNPLVPALVDPEVYQGELVCPFTPSWVDPEENWKNQWTRLDPGTGIFEYTIQSVNPVTARSASFMISGRAAIDRFIRFLHALSGRLKPFWLAANDRGFELTMTAHAGDTRLTIEDLDYDHALSGSPAHSAIELALTDGTVIRRKIIDAATLSTGEEQLTLDAGLPVDVSAARLNRCAWLEPMRLDSDEIMLHWVTSECIEATLPLVVLP